MKLFRTAIVAFTSATLAACGGGSGSEAEGTTTETSAETADASGLEGATTGQFVSCLLNDTNETARKHYVSPAAPVPAGATAESLEEAFIAAVEEKHGLAGKTNVAICNVGDQTSVTRGAAYTTSQSEERGLTKVEVEFP